MDTNGQKPGGNHEKHETHEKPVVWACFEPLMDTNGQKQGVTTKNTKHTKTRGVGMF